MRGAAVVVSSSNAVLKVRGRCCCYGAYTVKWVVLLEQILDIVVTKSGKSLNFNGEVGLRYCWDKCGYCCDKMIRVRIILDF